MLLRQPTLAGWGGTQLSCTIPARHGGLSSDASQDEGLPRSISQPRELGCRPRWCQQPLPKLALPCLAQTVLWLELGRASCPSHMLHQQLLHQAECQVTHQKGIKRLLLAVLSIQAQSTAAEAAHTWPEPCGHLPIQPPASRTTLLWQ